MFSFQSYEITPNSDLSMSVVFSAISAGEPLELEPALERVDLNQMLSRGSDSTLLLKVSGDSMEDVPIFSGDWIVLDRLKKPENGDIIVAHLGAGYTIKHYKLNDCRGNAGLYLVPANGAYKTKKLARKDNCEILGVVTFIIHPTTKT